MDICTRTLLPASDTFMGIAATGTLVSLVTRIALGPRLQVAISVLFFYVFWALALAATITILLPFGTCQFAISVDYMEYGATQALGLSFTNVAILLSLSASVLSSCLGAWDTIADEVGDNKDWQECGDRSWLAPVVLLAVEAADACREGMELSPPKPQAFWARLFWLWPRFIHNHIKGFRRLGSWAIAYELKRCQAPPVAPVANSSISDERTPLLLRPTIESVDSAGAH